MLLAVGDAAFADLYRDTLASVGWRVEVSHDWRATQKRLLDSLPDVLVLDSLPNMKQIDALERVRGQEATCALPVVLLTDTLQTGDLHRAQQLGVLGFLIKTRATRETLSETLCNMLEKCSAPDRSQG